MAEEAIELARSLPGLSQADAGAGKVVGLADAVSRYVEPGMSIFTAYEASAAISELIRQFQGKKPGFEMITTLLFDQTTLPLHQGLLRKVVFANSGYFYPSMAPNKIVQRAFRDCTVKLENWSHNTLQQRLMASAMGTGLMVTRSLVGTSLEEENADSLRVIDDPFGSGTRVGLVKALVPDVAIVHAVAADRFGNAITIPLPEDTIWGVRAAKKGILLTVEHVVSEETITSNPHLVRIPGHLVRAVSPVPYGAHPQGVIHPKLEKFQSYAADNQFRQDYFLASQEIGTMDQWVRKWILGCRDHDDYLALLGADRLLSLRERMTDQGWSEELESSLTAVRLGVTPGPREWMLVAAARKIEERVQRNGHNLLLVGIGMPALAGWPAYYNLKRKGHSIECIVGNGQFGYVPLPGDPNFVNMRVKGTCKMWSDIFEMYSGIISSPRSSCLSVLGAGQIDACGNINSSHIGDIYLAGSGGANDNTSLAAEVAVVAPQSARRFVKDLEHVTCVGEKVRTVVSTMGVFEKRHGQSEFSLTQCFPAPGLRTLGEHIARIKHNCGWDFEVSNDFGMAPQPDRTELLLLNIFDPGRLYLGE